MIQKCIYPVRKVVVHEIYFCDRAVIKSLNLPYSNWYLNTDWQFEMFKEANAMDMMLDKS